MSETATATHATGAVEELKKRPYVVVFVVLAVVTLVELSVYSLGLPHLETIIILVILATVKASLVVAYYMHLRYEPRWVALIPLAGLALVAGLGAGLTAPAAPRRRRATRDPEGVGQGSNGGPSRGESEALTADAQA